MSWHVLGDWGTTRLRLFRVEGGAITARAEGPGALVQDPAAALRAALAPWMREGAPAFIHLSGMAGSRTGLREVPYVDCPAGVAAWAGAATRFAFDGIPVKIAPGLACLRDGTPDVMRGEETQIFGACAQAPELGKGKHTFLLPGTHSKWAQVEDGRVLQFRTFVTGELFALLRGSSLLATNGAVLPEAEREGFEAGLARAASVAGAIGALFEARSAQLRAGRSASWASGFISGLLIGGEISEVRATLALLGPVAIIGSPELTVRYVEALARAGIGARAYDGDACVLAGLALLSD